MATNSKAVGILKRIVRLVAGVTVCIVALVVLYLLAAVAGTVWRMGATNAGKNGETTTVYVLSNGFHSDIVLPVTAASGLPGLPIETTDFDRELADARYLIVG